MWLRAALLWLLPFTALAGTAQLTWTAPTQTTGGQPLTGGNALTSYRLYERCGSAPQSLVASPSASSTAITRMTPDGVTCRWQLSAVNPQGESQRTTEVSRLMEPGAPVNLVITWAPTQGQGPPSMAIAVDSTSVGAAVSASSVTVSHTVSGSDRLLVVFANGEIFGETFTGVTYNGVAMTEIRQASVATFWRHSAWYLIAPDTGTHNIVATLSGTVDRPALQAISLTGVHQTTAIGTYGEQITTTGTAKTVNVSSATDELVVDCLFTTGAAGWGLTPGANQTARISEHEHSSMASRISTEAGATTVTMSWTAGTSTAAGLLAIPVKPAAAAAVTSLITPRRPSVGALMSF